MSQRINGRVTAVRRAASLPAIIIAILVIGGAAWGGLYWYSHRDGGKDAPGTPKTAADSVKSFLSDFEDSLKNIAKEKEPAKTDEEIAKIQTLASEDIVDLQKQAKDAPADVKTKITALITEYTPKLQAAVDAAYKVPGVKEKLEPLVTQIMTSLKGLST
jgi:hypothetical protein